MIRITTALLAATMTALGIAPAPAAAANERASGRCAAAWLGGAVTPLDVTRQAAGRADDAGNAGIDAVIDERVAESLRLVRDQPIDPPRAARAYAATLLAAREALLVSQARHPDLPQALVLDHAFAMASSAPGIQAPASAAHVAPAKVPRTLDEAWAAVVGMGVAWRVTRAFTGDGAESASTTDVEWESDPKRAAAQGTWVPTAPGFVPPLQPGWGKVRGIGLDPLDVRRDLEPPAWTSARMEGERQAFLALQRDIDPALVDIGHQWNDGSGTSTPAGTWIERADLETEALAPRERLELLAATSVAVHDAFVLSWDRKFTHMTARPIQWMKGVAWKAWKPWIPTPPFPSWPSGHATVSGAASEVIGTMVPAAVARQRAAAREAAQSRLWAGIHWKVDNDDGLVLGRALARDLAAASALCA